MFDEFPTTEEIKNMIIEDEKRYEELLFEEIARVQKGIGRYQLVDLMEHATHRMTVVYTLTQEVILEPLYEKYGDNIVNHFVYESFQLQDRENISKMILDESIKLCRNKSKGVEL
jgi:ubiquinone/menaquinone biosynthesis C-methylase UbiE